MKPLKIGQKVEAKNCAFILRVDNRVGTRYSCSYGTSGNYAGMFSREELKIWRKKCVTTKK